MRTTVERPDRTMDRLAGLLEDAAIAVMVLCGVLLIAAIVALAFAL